LYNQGIARRALLGEDTQNPSMAAKSLLGEGRISRAKKKLAKAGLKRRKSHRGNPLPALIGAVAVAGKVAKRLKGPAARSAERHATVDALMNRARLGDNSAVVELTRLSQAFATQEAKDYAAGQLALLAHGAVSTMGPATRGSLPGISAGITAGVVREVARTLRPKAPRRRRGYPAYTDRFGRERYSTRPPGSELRIPEGATPIAGTPYNFFRGAVGAGGAARTAGQFAVAGAAGLAAYYVTSKLLAALGGRAQRKEEAGVAAAQAFHAGYNQFVQEQGRKPNAGELKEMRDAYRQQLLDLGYDPVTFTRKRSAVEGFLETYNPFGG